MVSDGFEEHADQLLFGYVVIKEVLWAVRGNINFIQAGNYEAWKLECFIKRMCEVIFVGIRKRNFLFFTVQMELTGIPF